MYSAHASAKVELVFKRLYRHGKTCSPVLKAGLWLVAGKKYWQEIPQLTKTSHHKTQGGNRIVEVQLHRASS